MELAQVLESKKYKREKSFVTFASPSEYINPFVDLLDNNTNEFIVKVGNKVINENEDGTENVSFGRVVVEAKIGNQLGPEYRDTIGFLYALDTQKPIMKTYFGEEVTACTNLTVFGKADVFSMDLLGNTSEIYSRAEKYLRESKEKSERYFESIVKLKAEEYTYPQLENKLGAMLLVAQKTKLGTSPVVKASQYLLDNKSKYYVGSNKDFHCTGWNLYNAVTDALHSSDIVELPNKTVILSNFFGVN